MAGGRTADGAEADRLTSPRRGCRRRSRRPPPTCDPNLSACSASEAAVIGLTKSLGMELATSGVLVNAVAPAVIETPVNAATAPAVLDRLVAWLASLRFLDGRARY